MLLLKLLLLLVLSSLKKGLSFLFKLTLLINLFLLFISPLFTASNSTLKILTPILPKYIFLISKNGSNIEKFKLLKSSLI